MRRDLLVFIFVFAWFVMTVPAGAHCEIPCGIYNDPQRISMLEEHVATIEKSIKMIVELSATPEKDYNQLIRWIDNKETHAGYVQDIVTQYFMAQRVKPVDPGETATYEGYVKQLTALHQILVYAMKTKQSTDLKNVEVLKALIDEFQQTYFGQETTAVEPPVGPTP